MVSDRIGGGILLALIVCLTVAILLLGIELALVIKETDQLAPSGSVALMLAAGVLYAAAAWRGTQEGGPKLFFVWWATMVAGHAGLGLLLGFFRATLVGAPFDGANLLQWAGGISLPIGVLQAGYAMGISAVAYGNGHPVATPEPPARPQPLPRPPAPPALRVEPKPAAEAVRAPHFEVYAAAIDKLRAPDATSLIRFAAQAAKCDGGLLATRGGELVSTIEVAGLQAARIATVLPKLMEDLEQLGDPPRATITMLHAAFGGHELLAIAGTRLIACLVGPQPGSREIAEAVLPVLVARAEALVASVEPQPSAEQVDATPPGPEGAP